MYIVACHNNYFLQAVPRRNRSQINRPLKFQSLVFGYEGWRKLAPEGTVEFLSDSVCHGFEWYLFSF